jgi:AcrR family transcriptional regulator
VSDLEIKNRILDSAKEYYFQNGFSNSTMDDFAHSLGMSKKTIYKYFTSKDDIIREIVRQKLFRMDSSCKILHEDTSIDFIERVKSITTYLSKEMQAMKPTFFLDVQRTMPDLWKEIDAFRKEKIFNDFTQMVREGISLGIFRSDINVEVLVLMYENAISSILHPETLATLPLTASQAYEAIISIVLSGIFTEQAKEKYTTHATLVEKESI